ncbi:MAG TPA: hypothetical protein VGS22_28120 [Thermoanaerobaculia bacterium]|nr:hypothetical protein [Thermoanaerobaculia bacterium]
MLTVKKVAETSDEVGVEAALTLVSDWPLQDVNLTVELVSKSGEVIGRQFWKAITLGAWSRSYKPPKAEFRIPAERWRELFSEGAAPHLRITVDIQE